MEFATIEREVFVDASPEIVFDVVSSTEHIKQWWPDDATWDVVPGSTGEIVFGDRADGKVFALTVVDVRRPESFSFRWTHPFEEPAAAGNSLHVTFDLTPSGSGTLLKMTETGFRELGWDEAKVEQEYRSHVGGWDFYMPRVAPYAETLEVQA